ncbi:MAG: hypothetical protein HY816_05450 [Candidatus Wallbacteria bacterium]|nr:hypothetical protein [Candidatus Wallbacteria bacterium]
MPCCASSLSCPHCREPLAPKGVELGCGSCGQKVPVDLHGFARRRAARAALLVALALVPIGFCWTEAVRESAGLAAAERARDSEMRIVRARCETDQLRRKLRDAHGELSAAREEVARLECRKVSPAAGPDGNDVLAEADDSELRGEIEFLEGVAQKLPDAPEVHFRLAMAYDRLSSDPEASSKCFLHAKKAIKLDPAYKRKFQPMLKSSRLARRVAEIIHEIIQKSEDSRIPDDEAERYAEEIGKLLGDRADRGPGSGPLETPDPESIRRMIQDPQRRDQLRRLWDRPGAAEPDSLGLGSSRD